uniref:Uncharacterized protein n=1 Tax=Glypta fumiferanae TaxID=389681 RepID=A0A0F6Q8U1_9HYME|nr:hypothetical protein [Glypta fumiferanae]
MRDIRLSRKTVSATVENSDKKDIIDTSSTEQFRSRSESPDTSISRKHRRSRSRSRSISDDHAANRIKRPRELPKLLVYSDNRHGTNYIQKHVRFNIPYDECQLTLTFPQCGDTIT